MEFERLADGVTRDGRVDSTFRHYRASGSSARRRGLRRKSPPPKDDAYNDGGYKRITYADVRGRRTAKVRGQQNRPEYRRARNRVEHSADEFEHAETRSELDLPAEVFKAFGEIGRTGEFHGGTKQEHQHGQRAHDTAGPKHAF